MVYDAQLIKIFCYEKASSPNRSSFFIYKHKLKASQIGADKTHVAALHFSSNVWTDFRFTDTDMYNRDKLFRAIKNIPRNTVLHSGLKNLFQATKLCARRTYTKAALQQADEDFFCPSCGSRNIQKVLVVISDGKSNDQGSLAGKSFAKVTASLKNKGVHIIAVGIGPGADMDEMKEIATKPKYALRIRKADAIERHLHNLATLMCE
ncbi:collagen alpha-1(XII) chain-like [Hydractinia symbiolongicarpus]|uniref:collagen alpha-1(XII) chain-like n=1 Tax=Hydractinia symbiolongicarpus TaxID=13093 RepID=UPI002549F9B6|nr:collagen alpha-1(XII) chain-like [Hydractinia symbiolongicarpus]